MKRFHFLLIVLLGPGLIGAADVENPLVRPATLFEGAIDAGRDAEVQRLVETRIRRLVEDLLDQDHYVVAYQNLLNEGKASAPHLVAALKDPRFHKARRRGPARQLPMSEVVELLLKAEPEAAVRELIVLLNNPKGVVRRNAAFYLGRTASDDCAKAVAGVLAGKDHEMQVLATRGIAQAASENRISPAFGKAVFEPLAAILAAEDEVSGEVPKCLVKIDAKRAAGVLVDDKFIDPASYLLLPVLDALVDERVAVPQEKIVRLLGQLRPDANRYPDSREYGLGLLILAHNRCPRTQELINQTLTWGDKETRVLALRARCVWEGIPDPDSLVRKLDEKNGLSTLSEPQKKMIHVLKLEDHVGDEGFEDYFSCTCGRNAAATVPALREIGALKTAHLLQKAMDAFGEKGPSRNTEVRNEQMSSLTDEQFEEFDRLSREFGKDRDELRILLLQFALKHKDHFRPAGTATAPASAKPAASQPASKAAP